MRRHFISIMAVGLLLVAIMTAQAVTIPEGDVVPIVVTGAVQSPWLAPFVLSEQIEAVYGELYSYSLKVGSWQDDPDWLGGGNFGLIDIVANSNTQEEVAGTTGTTLAIDGEVIRDTAPGEKTGQLLQGMESRLQGTAYTDEQYQAWAADGYPLDRRIMVLPVVHQELINGVRSMTVVGFAGFYIDSYTFSPQQKAITGVFTYLPEEAVVTPEPSGLLALFAGSFAFVGLVRRRGK